jgi:hypothetical protein
MSGEYVLTASDIRKVHTELRRELNVHQERRYEQALAWYEKLGGKKAVTALIKEKTGFGNETKLCALARQMNIPYDIKNDIFSFKGNKPTKSGIIKSYTSKSTDFEDDNGAVIFDFSTNVIRVHTEDNNHSVDRFCDDILFNALHRLLSSLKWSRKETGGCLYYIDEYMREFDNYSTQPRFCFGRDALKNSN